VADPAGAGVGHAPPPRHVGHAPRALRHRPQSNPPSRFRAKRLDKKTNHPQYLAVTANAKINKQLEMRSVERGICPIATSIMNELFQ